MIRTGAQYRDSIRDGRQVWVDGERVADVATHPLLQPLVDARARVYDLQHEAATRAVLTFEDDDGERHPVANKLPLTQEDWWEKRRATDTVLEQVGADAVDGAVGEMWSLFDALDLLNELAPRFSANIRCHVNRVLHDDPCHVSVDGDPRGDRDLLLRVVRETAAGIVLRGAKCAAAAAHANQALVTDRAAGFICDLGSAGLRFLCGDGATLILFEDVLVPWENVLFLHSAQATELLAATRHRYRAFAWLQRELRQVDQGIGVARREVLRAGREQDPAARRELALLACRREALNAHLTASITLSERSPAGLMMPNQSLLHTGRALAAGAPDLEAVYRHFDWEALPDTVP